MGARFLTIGFVLMLSLTGFGGRPVAAATAFDSAYQFESAFLILKPGDTGTLSVFFSNTGTSAWVAGLSDGVRDTLEDHGRAGGVLSVHVFGEGAGQRGCGGLPVQRRSRSRLERRQDPSGGLLPGRDDPVDGYWNDSPKRRPDSGRQSRQRTERGRRPRVLHGAADESVDAVRHPARARPVPGRDGQRVLDHDRDADAGRRRFRRL